jgi:glutaredoxin
MRIVVYTVGHECPLCDEALAHLERLRARRAFDLRTVVVDGDPHLAIRHALRVPVIEVDGREVAYGRVDPEALERVVLEGGTVHPPA